MTKERDGVGGFLPTRAEIDRHDMIATMERRYEARDAWIRHAGSAGPVTTADLADALIAAGYRRTPEPRTVTTAEELDALPEGSVLRSYVGCTFQRVDVGDSEGWDWMVIGSDEYRDWGEVEELIPATILYTPPK